jgi:uncharacterized protein YndB with AHSA1/START domain
MTAPNTSNAPLAQPDEPAFVLTRVLDAPRELVFKAFTEPERLMHWWAPKGFTMRTGTLDLRPGGVFHYCQASPGGQEMWGKFVYREVSPPERLVYVNSFADAQGNTVRAPFSATWPLEILSTVTFTEQDGKTTLGLRGVALNATEAEQATFVEAARSLEAGWGGTLAQLEAYLALNK